MADVEKAILGSLKAEQQAFAVGDCEATSNFLSSDLLFVVGARVRTREAVLAGCASMAKNGPPFSRKVERHKVFVLSSEAAYTVTTYAVSRRKAGGEGPPLPQVVTKVWVNEEGTWRIVHVNESMGRPRSR
jgi:ketosteroid isomerase-like protein